MTQLMSEELSTEAIEAQVERILGSEQFARSRRLRNLLRFTVSQTLQGNAESLKEYLIGTEVLNKPDSYDPRSDSLVRVLASRLRLKLKEYYRDGGNQDPLLIDFPKGRYVPCFRRRDQLRTENENKVRARAAYSCGRFLAAKLTDEALGESIAHFNEAIAADSSWPLAYIGLANVYAFQALMGFRRPREVWPLARAAAQTALQIDEMSSKAHIVLALERVFFEWHWEDAEAHLVKALETDPYSGFGHLWRAIAWLIPMGRLSAANEEIARACELGPSNSLEEAKALAAYFSEQYDAALHVTKDLAPAGASPTWLPWLRGAVLAVSGRHGAAINLLRLLLVNYRPEYHHEWGSKTYYTQLRLDPLGTAEAQELLTALQAKRERGTWISNFDLALIQTGLGNRAEALTCLQESLREKEPWLVYLTVDPRLSPLRAASKFPAFVKRIGLTHAEVASSAM